MNSARSFLVRENSNSIPYPRQVIYEDLPQMTRSLVFRDVLRTGVKGVNFLSFAPRTGFPALRVSYVYLHRVLSGFLDCLSPF